ncbi:TRAP transporter substrate-binding protein [Pontitalea aquivivens]|uniref:TRAP transporter substrate-binding protein n=1 Tax=Pontitalea aquivivens TaxID=3388663 RepID=UPI003970B200
MEHAKTLAAAAAIAASAFFGALPASAQDKIVLKYSSWFPPAHSLNTALKQWISDVETATEGRVTVEYLPATVGTPRDQFDVAAEGLADITLVLPGYTPGRFPLMELGELPLQVETDQARLAPAFNRVYDNQLAKYEPFKGTHVLTVFASAPTSIVTSADKPVTSIDGLKGLKLRAPSATASQVIDALGAVTVQKPVTEIYELASTGVVDGTFFSLMPIISWKTESVFKNITLMPGGMGQSVIALLINQAKWDSIPEGDRAAIMSVSGPALAALVGDVWQNDEVIGKEKLDEIGGFTYHEPSAEFVAAFKAAMTPVDKAWADKVAATGVDNPQGILDALRAELAASK